MISNRVGRLWVTLFWVSAALAGLSGPAGAADPIGTLSISPRIGVSGYDMAAINAGINRSNTLIQQLGRDWQLPGRIHSGFDFMVDAAYDVVPSLRLGIVYDKTSGSTGVDYKQKISVNPQATMLIPRAYVKLPWRPMTDMSLRVFGGLVMLRNVTTKVEHQTTSSAVGGSEPLEAITIKASGNGFIGGLMGEYTLSDRFTIGFEGGYRKAKAKFKSGSYSITNLDNGGAIDQGQVLPNDRRPNQDSYLWGFFQDQWQQYPETEPKVRTDLDSDFSGLVLQIGLRLYIY